jgi:hypothetical protein
LATDDTSIVINKERPMLSFDRLTYDQQLDVIRPGFMSRHPGSEAWNAYRCATDAGHGLSGTESNARRAVLEAEGRALARARMKPGDMYLSRDGKYHVVDR